MACKHERRVVMARTNTLSGIAQPYVGTEIRFFEVFFLFVCAPTAFAM